MQILKTTLLGLFFGTFGTTLGGIIGCFFNRVSNKFLSFILSFASGLMMSVICFDLIPEALRISNILWVIFGILFGIISMIFCGEIVQRKFSNINYSENSLLKTGIIVSIGLAIHNFPEGLAIGSGFDVSNKLGIGLALSICLHDIPEGISMAVPMKNGGMSVIKVIFYVVLSGVTTGIGAFFRSNNRNNFQNNNFFIFKFCCTEQCFILYLGELIPESNSLYKGRMSSIGNMLGFIIGIFATKI